MDNGQSSQPLASGMALGVDLWGGKFMKATRLFKCIHGDPGISLTEVAILTLLGMTSLHLAGQDVPGISALKEESGAQQLAEAAAELVVTWFHDPVATPPFVMGTLTKRQGDEASGPSYFDAAGRSQFAGTLL